MPNKSKTDKKRVFSDNFSTYFEAIVGKKTDAITKGSEHSVNLQLGSGSSGDTLQSSSKIKFIKGKDCNTK